MTKYGYNHFHAKIYEKYCKSDNEFMYENDDFFFSWFLVIGRRLRIFILTLYFISKQGENITFFNRRAGKNKILTSSDG